MHNKYATLKGTAVGAAAAAAAGLFACVFIRSLGLIAHYAVPGQIETILSQLSGAKVMPPLLPALAAGAAVGALLLRDRFITLKAIVLFAVLLPLCIWFADVNTIRFAAAAQSGSLTTPRVGPLSRLMIASQS